MDGGWLKAKAEKLAQAAQQRADDLQARASQLAEATLQNAIGAKSGTKDVEFVDWELGFTLECITVVAVEAGEQAERLGVEVGDRLMAVDGYPVPPFEAGTKEETKAKKMVKQWMEEMPRPVTLSFRPLAPPPQAEASAAVPRSGGGALDEAKRRARERLEEAQRRAQEAEAADACVLGAAAKEEPSTTAGACAWAEAADAPDDIFEVGDDDEEVEEPVTAEAAPSPDDQAGDTHAADPTDPDDGPPSATTDVAGDAGGEEARALWEELRRLRAQSAAGLEVEKRKGALLQKKVMELQKQVAALRAENKEILLNASSGEADNFEALEAAEAREATLQEEVARLREALQNAVVASVEATAQRTKAAEEVEQAQMEAMEAQRSADAKQAVAVAEATANHAKEVEALTGRLEEAEARATEANLRLEVMDRELRGFGRAHEAEIELQLEEQRKHERQVRRQLEEKERQALSASQQAAKELEAARQEVEEARREASEQRARAEAAAADAQAAAVEAASARMEAASASATLKEATGTKEEAADDAGEDLEAMMPSRGSRGQNVDALLQQIASLERRCVTLQKKLNARPPVSPLSLDPGASPTERPVWEKWVTLAVGPQVAELAVLAYFAADGLLRSLTKQLLRRSILLWLFYGHLLVLYTVSMSCFSQATSGVDGDPVDAINVLIKDSHAHEHEASRVHAAPAAAAPEAPT